MTPEEIRDITIAIGSIEELANPWDDRTFQIRDLRKPLLSIAEHLRTLLPREPELEEVVEDLLIRYGRPMDRGAELNIPLKESLRLRAALARRREGK